ncbi:MAG: hypothetical protein R6W68_08645 [Ignavibacteriaceae bacterium]
MTEPTEKLASILNKNGSKMTIFWDILHYYKLLEFEKRHPELKHDRLLIEKQILDLAGRGHDVQLHLHPHWLDAKYADSKWNFTYERFKLHSLSTEKNDEDINTITGCVKISKNLMENLIRNVNPNYKVTTFRAGGYLIEPFEQIRDALKKNEIMIDSSSCPGIYNNNDISPYDFRFYPTKSKYSFSLTPKTEEDNGDFIEIPIAAIKLPIIRYIYFKVLRRSKYPSLENERKGDGVGSMSIKKRNIKTDKFFSILLSPRIVQFTTDSNFRERFSYIFKKVPEYATMILHPKLLNSHTMRILDDYVTTNKIHFISIQDYIPEDVKLNNC